MGKVTDRLFGTKVGRARVIPIEIKIVTIFSVLLLVSNIASNYLNISYNRTEMVQLMRQLLVKDLKELYNFSNVQYQIYQYERDKEKASNVIAERATQTLSNKRSVAMGVYIDGEYFFRATDIGNTQQFPDRQVMEDIRSRADEGMQQGNITFTMAGQEYIGMYKYHPDWQVYLIRGEEIREFYSDTQRIFETITIIVSVFTLITAVLGVLVLRYLLRFVRRMTTEIMDMQSSQQLGLVSLRGAPNDDVTYLGAAFNTLSSTINNLLQIFRRFVTADIVQRAYAENEVRLEGSRQRLTVLFTDIRGFTFMTETLGTDIIRLLNIHYHRAIGSIHEHNGVVGSIIGDALLAMYGTFGDSEDEQAVESLRSAYKIYRLTAELRGQMTERRKQIEAERGDLTEEEERVFKAVAIDVGVGLDGGDVFYGNIGSLERMTNTVIGDNVNAASRLEGLTRIYQVPVICSDYVKDNATAYGSEFTFVEIDRVKVKGKTQSSGIYWPVPEDELDEELNQKISIFSDALHHYYDGDWATARRQFKECKLSVAEVFLDRIGNKNQAPEGWDGIWQMETK
jgi:class 3 adenylate cyclase